MEVRAYQVRDLKAGLWQFPFPAVNDDLAIRMMMEKVLREPESTVSQFPSDFELYFIGTMKQETADWELNPPTFVCSFSDIVKQAYGAQEETSSGER